MLKVKNIVLGIFKISLLKEIFYSSIGILCIIVLFKLLPYKLFQNPFKQTIISILIIIFLFVFLLINQTKFKFKIFKVNYNRNIILFTIFYFSIYYALFFQTEFGLNGDIGDNWYRSALITKMSYLGYPHDFAYKDLSSFYSPLYWYCLALYSKVSGIEAFRMIRFGLLFSIIILPSMIYETWKKIYKNRTALFISVISFVFLFNIYSVDHSISYFFIIPYFMYYYENYSKKKFKFYNYVIAGILGALIFCTFFIYFLIIPFYYLVNLILNRKDFLRNKAKSVIYISFFVILFSSWFWVPLLGDIITYGFESHQNRYFRIDMVEELPLFSFLTLDFFGFILLVGVIYIFFKYQLSRDLKILGILLISVYLIYLMGLIGVLILFPIMHIRFLEITNYSLLISFSIFYSKIFKDIKIKLNLKSSFKHIQISLFLLIILYQNHVNLNNLYNSQLYENSFNIEIPTEIIGIFEELEYEGKIFLTKHWRVAVYIPIFLFIPYNPMYSHPAALYNQRISFLFELSNCLDSKTFYEKILNSTFKPIDYFFLDVDENLNLIFKDAFTDKFPEPRTLISIEFKNYLFNNSLFFEEIKLNITGEMIYRVKY